jgi:uncharacterized surface protein with fasciclin (FAS1) repeats
MSNLLKKSIGATLGLVIASAGLCFTVSTQAQTGTSGSTPVATPTPTPVVAPVAAPIKKKLTIVDFASKRSHFSKLVAALKAADLVDTLAGDGPFTVFAPTNAAFAKLPKGTLENLLKPENKEQLKKLLTYHVVSGSVTSKMLKNGQKVATVEGSSISITKLKNGRVLVNKAVVTNANLKTDNGTVHVIDRVLMPAAASTAPAAPAASTAPAK